jgi:CTP synthase
MDEGRHLPEVEIAIVGKYDNCDEAYLSLKEALFHAGVHLETKVKIRWIRSEELETAKDMRGVWKHFEGVDGIIVPGGFGDRGIEGKIRAIKYVREKKIPFLGICLGLQCAVIEISRNLADLEDANSAEFNPETPYPVVHFVEGQEGLVKKSGTMRLGAYDCELIRDSLAFELYKKKLISERHRHRYEVNSEYKDKLGQVGFCVSGENPESKLIEIMELDRAIHPYFIGTQAHPEFRSRLTAPAPLFVGLISAAGIRKKSEIVTPT